MAFGYIHLTVFNMVDCKVTFFESSLKLDGDVLLVLINKSLSVFQPHGHLPLFLERFDIFLFLDAFNDVLARFTIFHYNFWPNHLFNFVVRVIVNRIPSSCLGQLCFVRIYNLLFRHRKTPELFWIRLHNLAYVSNPVMFQMLIAFELDLI